jgi:hypothetical protein
MSVKGIRLILTLLLVCGLATVRGALANASGCSRDFSLGTPSQASDGTPDCAPGGDGCYECAYTHQNLSGYDICAEPADPEAEVLPTCALDVANIPNWWPDPVADSSPPGDQPPPGDSNPSGPGDDGGGFDAGGGGGGGGGGDPYPYSSIAPPSFLYPPPHHRPYNPNSP